MKMKKALASVAAVAMAASMVSAFSVSTSALTEGTKIDFEDGDYSFVYLNLDDGSDNSVLSVEDYDGSKQLKVDVQQTGKVPKVGSTSTRSLQEKTPFRSLLSRWILLSFPRAKLRW